jgi:hypothetical protein
MPIDDKATHLIRKLLSHPSAQYVLSAHRWPYEADRQHELVISLMRPVLGLPEGGARSVCDRLRTLNLLNITAWRADSNGTQEALRLRARAALREHGVGDDAAETAVETLAELAAFLDERCEGKVQLWLRLLGEQMLSTLADAMPFTMLSTSELHEALTHWLQNVANLPLPIRDASTREFCQTYTVTPAELLAAADALDLNAGVLDDLVHFHMVSTANAEDRRGG